MNKQQYAHRMCEILSVIKQADVIGKLTATNAMSLLSKVVPFGVGLLCKHTDENTSVIRITITDDVNEDVSLFLCPNSYSDLYDFVLGRHYAGSPKQVFTMWHEDLKKEAGLTTIVDMTKTLTSHGKVYARFIERVRHERASE